MSGTKGFISSVLFSLGFLSSFKGAYSGLTQFLATECPLEMMIVIKTFQFLSWIFGQAGKGLDKMAKVNFKIYDVTNQITSNNMSNISRSKGKKFGQLTE